MQTNEERRVTYSAVTDNGYHKSIYLIGHNSVALRLLRTLADNCKNFPSFTRTTTSQMKNQSSVLLVCLQHVFQNGTEVLSSYYKKFFVITKPADNPSSSILSTQILRKWTNYEEPI
jgi:hypothetical protein